MAIDSNGKMYLEDMISGVGSAKVPYYLLPENGKGSKEVKMETISYHGLF